MNPQFLLDRNQKYLTIQGIIQPDEDQKIRTSLKATQTPHTAVLGCADSRVPIERIFAAKPGEIFSIRVAGNHVNEDVVANLEFSVFALGVTFGVVLGHTSCGAIQAAMDVRHGKKLNLPKNLENLVDTLANSLPESLSQLDEAIQFNVQNTIDQIQAKSPDLRKKIQQKEFSLVGAIYDIETGQIRFYDA